METPSALRFHSGFGGDHVAVFQKLTVSSQRVIEYRTVGLRVQLIESIA